MLNGLATRVRRPGKCSILPRWADLGEPWWSAAQGEIRGLVRGVVHEAARGEIHEVVRETVRVVQPRVPAKVRRRAFRTHLRPDILVRRTGLHDRRVRVKLPATLVVVRRA